MRKEKGMGMSEETKDMCLKDVFVSLEGNGYEVGDVEELHARIEAVLIACGGR